MLGVRALPLLTPPPRLISQCTHRGVWKRSRGSLMEDRDVHVSKERPAGELDKIPALEAVECSTFAALISTFGA